MKKIISLLMLLSALNVGAQKVDALSFGRPRQSADRRKPTCFSCYSSRKRSPHRLRPHPSESLEILSENVQAVAD